MDELKIKTSFMKGVISALVRKAVKKYGYDIVLDIHDLDLKTIDSSDNNNTIVHADVTIKMNNNDLKRLIARM